MSDFICITFGPDGDRDQWYNHKECFSSKRAAIRKGMDSLCIAGCFGYVIIEEGEDFWEVVEECGAPKNKVEVGYKNHSYYVQLISA